MDLFGHKTEPKVLLTYDVIMKCQCAGCPVQANSACAKPKIIARDEMMKNTPKEQIDSMKPKAEDMPGPYCANGLAVCKDFDFSKMCICSGCQVYKDYNFKKAKPTIYFCKDGKAT